MMLRSAIDGLARDFEMLGGVESPLLMLEPRGYSTRAGMPFGAHKAGVVRKAESRVAKGASAQRRSCVSFEQ
jgi:hypothetical protein